MEGKKPPPFSEGNANFPRLGWSLFGMLLATGSYRLNGWDWTLWMMGFWALVWVCWASYLCGKRRSWKDCMASHEVPS